MFKTRYSYFKYQVISFELTNVPANFQRYINKIFAKQFNIFIIVYLDNIFIYINDDGDGHVAVV